RRPWITNMPDGRRRSAARLLMALVLGALALAFPRPADPATAGPNDLICNQTPGNRFFWVEWAFCYLKAIGPADAQGCIIWNRGISNASEQWRAPAPLALRLLQSRGWDVIVIKRHNLAETGADYSLYRATERTRQEIRRQRQNGYRKIVLAGQSFGGYV